MADNHLPETFTKSELFKKAQERFSSWAKMYANPDVTAQQMHDDMCCSVYSSDEYYNVQGIIKNDVNGLIDILCHIVIADYAASALIDSQVINMPDHSEIIATICAQLKHDNVDIHRVYDAINKADTANWFSSNDNECSQVMSGIKEVWDRA